MSYRNPDDDTKDEYAVSSDDTFIDGTQKPRLARTGNKAAVSATNGSGKVSRSNSKSNKETSQAEALSEARKRRAKSTKTTKTKTSTEAKVSATRSGLTRQEAQAADPRSQGTAFSLRNLEQLAAESLQHRPSLQRRAAYATTSATTAAMSTSAAIITKPSFTYREEGPLPRTEAEHHASLTAHIRHQELTSLIPASHPRPREIARMAATRALGSTNSLYLSQYATPDLTKIGLYDVIVFCDDSSSMLLEERYSTLKSVVRRIARIAAAYNPTGIKIRFINSQKDPGFNGIVTEEQVETCLDAVQPENGTALGTKLFEKVVRPLIVEKAKRGELDKPVVVSIVTDGEVCLCVRGWEIKDMLMVHR